MDADGNITASAQASVADYTQPTLTYAQISITSLQSDIQIITADIAQIQNAGFWDWQSIESDINTLGNPVVIIDGTVVNLPVNSAAPPPAQDSTGSGGSGGGDPFGPGPSGDDSDAAANDTSQGSPTAPTGSHIIHHKTGT